MSVKMKKELINDVVTGLMVAATFAAVAPAGVSAANLSGAVGLASTNFGVPFLQTISYISYGFGTVLTVAGIAGAKKHADAPQQNPLGPVLGRIGAGAAFLAAPGLIGVIQGSGSETFTGTGTVSTIGGF
jgi:hypothetical protein